MTAFEKYIKYMEEWSDVAFNGNYEKSDTLADEGNKFRDENFTKADWEYLISVSSGRAKYEYTKKMKELFPGEETDTNKNHLTK